MIKIMIVEDDPMVMDINKKFVSKLEFCEVVAAVNSISDAKKRIQEKRIDLVLLDVFLPDGKGIDYLKWLRKEEISTDVLLITADKSAISVEEAFRYGAVDYLIKPFKFERLESVLTTYYEKYQFKTAVELSQEEIDQLKKYRGEVKADVLGSEPSTEEGESGINMTYQKIIDFVREKDAEGTTAQEVSTYLGVSRVTARRYLELMEKSGALAVQHVYGGIGRPKNVYRLNKEKE